MANNDSIATIVRESRFLFRRLNHRDVCQFPALRRVLQSSELFFVQFGQIHLATRPYSTRSRKADFSFARPHVSNGLPGLPVHHFGQAPDLRIRNRGGGRNKNSEKERAGNNPLALSHTPPRLNATLQPLAGLSFSSNAPATKTRPASACYDGTSLASRWSPPDHVASRHRASACTGA